MPPDEATHGERIAKLEANCDNFQASLSSVWKKVDDRDKDGDVKMDKLSTDLKDEMKASWDKVFNIFKIFIPVCMILFSILLGWSFVIQAQVMKTTATVESVMKHGEEVQKQTLDVLQKISNKLEQHEIY